VWFVAVCVIATTIWRRRAQLVGTRGMGVRADVARLHDVPRVRVRDLTMTDAESARLELVATDAPEGADADGVNGAQLVALEFSIALQESDPGFRLLHDWINRRCVLGIVMPADSRIIRLRCLEDLQPLTLRRLDPR
jgi:hypothetical protein